MKFQYYLHFETKPSFEELDVFFQKCTEYHPILATSYFVEIDTDDLRQTAREFAHECFPRYTYIFTRVIKKEFEVNRESDYVTAGIRTPYRFPTGRP